MATAAINASLAPSSIQLHVPDVDMIYPINQRRFNHMPRLFGPSDFQNVTIPHEDGTVHKHKLAKREAVPGYGNATRSLPVITTECVDCISHLKSAGFNGN